MKGRKHNNIITNIFINKKKRYIFFYYKFIKTKTKTKNEIMLMEKIKSIKVYYVVNIHGSHI